MVLSFKLVQVYLISLFQSWTIKINLIHNMVVP